MPSGRNESRHYVDPWDVENYVYLRTALAPAKQQQQRRRRSVAFHSAVRYASYPDDGPLSLNEVYQLEEPISSVYDEPSSFVYHHPSSIIPTQHPCPHCLDYSSGDISTCDDYKDYYSRVDDSSLMMSEENFYEDLLKNLAKRNRRRRTQLKRDTFAIGTLGHLKIDYTDNWTDLDRYIGNNYQDKMSACTNCR